MFFPLVESCHKVHDGVRRKFGPAVSIKTELIGGKILNEDSEIIKVAIREMNCYGLGKNILVGLLFNQTVL